jgi:antitoxin component of MazEF toxin-antitoxin module
MVLTKISKSNRSLIITIPREFVKKMELQQKDYLQVFSTDKNILCFQKVVVTPSRVLVDGKDVTNEVPEPFVNIEDESKHKEDKPNW